MFSIHSSPIGELGTKNTGGMSVYIRELARHLGVFGHRIDIYTKLNGSKHNQISELYDNVRLIHLSAGSNGHAHKLALYYYLSDFLRALRPDSQPLLVVRTSGQLGSGSLEHSPYRHVSHPGNREKQCRFGRLRAGSSHRNRKEIGPNLSANFGPHRQGKRKPVKTLSSTC